MIQISKILHKLRLTHAIVKIVLNMRRGFEPKPEPWLQIWFKKKQQLFLEPRANFILAVQTWTEKQKKIPNAITLTALAKIIAIKTTNSLENVKSVQMTAAFSRQKRMFISFFDDMTLWNRSKTRVYFDKITSDALKIKPNSVVSYYCTIVNGWIFNASDVKSKIGQVKSNWPLEKNVTHKTLFIFNIFRWLDHGWSKIEKIWFLKSIF